MIEELIEISESVAYNPEYVQGGGGNTSVKSEDGVMLIKASGFELKELNLSNGYTCVNWHSISDYFKKIEVIDPIKQDNESVQFILNQVIISVGDVALRPSMETGFHSILNKYVIHTHSVYSNIINCSNEPDILLSSVFKDSDLIPLFIRYYNPGFELSITLIKETEFYKYQYKKSPSIIFLQNHGLIVTSDSKEEVISLHNKVNERLKSFFNIKENYPQIALTKIDDNKFESNSEYIVKSFVKYKPDSSFFENVLFPDQTVFFTNNFNFDTRGLYKKININCDSHKIIYSCSYKEAMVIEETITAYMFILDQLLKNGLKPKFLNLNNLNRINSMESEKYRKDMMK